MQQVFFLQIKNMAMKITTIIKTINEISIYLFIYINTAWNYMCRVKRNNII